MNNLDNNNLDTPQTPEKSTSKKFADCAVLFGIPVVRQRETEVLERIFEMLEQPRSNRCRLLITLNVDFVTNAVSTFFHHGTPGLLEALQRADLATADGMPLVLLSKLLRCPIPGRVTGADLVPRIAEEAARRGKKLYILGGTEESTGTAQKILQKKSPNLQIVGIDTSFIRLDDVAGNREVCRKINAAQPDLLLVALGNPKQELWMAQHAAELQIPAAIGIGGSFNFLSGAVKRAPMWMQRCGVEWIYRIVQEPRRLWKRYGLGLLKFNYLTLKILSLRLLGCCFRNQQNALSFSRCENDILEVDFSGISNLNQAIVQDLCRAGNEADLHNLHLRLVHVSPFCRLQLKHLCGGRYRCDITPHEIQKEK